MKSYLWLLFSLGATLHAFSQGTITGTVSDESIGETLISAYVYVEGTDAVTATDFDGNYVLDLEAGTYRLRFTYIGFEDKVVTEVVVKDGETTFLDVSLSSESLELDEVVVTAAAIERTENAMLMLQRRSNKIQDGISRQEMSRMASGNVANAMTKVTGASVQDGKYVYIRGLGDRYSITQLNSLPMPSVDPYRNSAQLDMIPVNLLDNIVTSKTFTPDQPGTFTGGNINIKTKSFPERQTFSAKVAFRYNTQDNFQNDFLTYDGANSDWLGYGSKFRSRPGVLTDSTFLQYADRNGELEARFGNEEAATKIQEGVDAVDMRFDTVVTTSPIDYAVSLAYGNSWDVGNGRLGVIASGSFAQRYTHRPEAIQATYFVMNEDDGTLMNSGDYRQTTSQQSPTLNGLVGIAYKFDDLNSIDAKMMYNHNSVKTGIFSIGEDGQNIEDPTFKLGRALLWEERELFNYQFTGRHVIPGANNLEIDWRGSIVNATLQEPNLRFFSSQYNKEDDTHGIPLANVNDPFFFWRNLQDDIFTGALDLTYPMKFFGNTGEIKVGGWYSAKDRDFDEFRNIVAISPNSTSFREFGGDVNAFLGPTNSGVIDTQMVGSKTRYTVANYINEATRIENSYSGYEDVWAAYGMITLSPWDPFRMVLGGRYEYTDIFVQSKIVDVIEEEQPDSTNTGSITSGVFLPSINLIYSLNDEMNLRASFNQTLARPNLREIAPFASFDPLIDQFFIGNPNLGNTDIYNVDLRWEWFLSPGEIFAVSGFYKNFDNPISLQYLNSSNPEFQFTNVDKGEIMGLEIELRKNLSFINDRLSNLRLLTNFSFIQSSTDVIVQSGLEPADRPFEGQAPFIANVGLNYQTPDEKLDLILTYNYLGDRLAFIGREAPDIYDRAVNTLDFVANYRFGPSDRLYVKLACQNLLNPLITRSQIYEDLNGESVEYVNQQFRRGANFTLSFEYKL